MKIELTHKDGGKITVFSEYIMTIYDGGGYTQLLLSGGTGLTVIEKYENVLETLKPAPANTKQKVGRG